jgi:aminoglycoside 3-N-acetyltransferase
VFWGKQADHLMSRQPWNYAFGPDSPLERFLMLDGKIVLLGCDHDTVTFLHYVEHVADIPGKRVVRYQVPVNENGSRVWRAVEEYDTSDDGVHANWPDRFFAKIVDSFLIQTRNHGRRVGNGMTYLVNARELFDFALPLMQAVAADPRAAEPLKVGSG